MIAPHGRACTHDRALRSTLTRFAADAHHDLHTRSDFPGRQSRLNTPASGIRRASTIAFNRRRLR